MLGLQKWSQNFRSALEVPFFGTQICQKCKIDDNDDTHCDAEDDGDDHCDEDDDNAV